MQGFLWRDVQAVIEDLTSMIPLKAREFLVEGNIPILLAYLYGVGSERCRQRSLRTIAGFWGRKLGVQGDERGGFDSVRLVAPSKAIGYRLTRVQNRRA